VPAVAVMAPPIFAMPAIALMGTARRAATVARGDADQSGR